MQSQKKKKKLTRLKRTLWLCQPKNSEIIKENCDRCNSFTKPITPVTEKALHYFPSNRIMDLSEPKPFVMGRVYMEHVSSDCLMVVSKHAQKCKGKYLILYYFSIKSLYFFLNFLECSISAHQKSVNTKRLDSMSRCFRVIQFRWRRTMSS